METIKQIISIIPEWGWSVIFGVAFSMSATEYLKRLIPAANHKTITRLLAFTLAAIPTYLLSHEIPSVERGIMALFAGTLAPTLWVVFAKHIGPFIGRFLRQTLWPWIRAKFQVKGK